MTPRIEKTVFISYRRTNLPWALAIYQYLTSQGYDVFFDYLSIPSGDFEKIIVENIKSRAHFIVVLTPSALERCNELGDWLRREIETAMDEKRNIVPLMLESFDFGSSPTLNALTGKLENLKKYNGLRVPSEYFFEAMNRLRERFLNVPLDAVIHPIPESAKPVTAENQVAANEAAPVEKEELTAQEWFERGYVFQHQKNFDEAHRCYMESIRLQPNVSESHNNLGIVLSELNRYGEAEAAYHKAIELKPSDYTAYSNLGNLLVRSNRYERAEIAFRKAIELDPTNSTPYSNLGLLLHEKLNRYDEAEAILRQAIGINPLDADAYYNFGNLLRDENLKRYEEAEVAYRKAINLNPEYAAAYNNLGSTLVDLKRAVEAEAAYRKAIELNPAFATAYYNFGILLNDLKRYNEAEANYRKAIEFNTMYIKAYNNLGRLLNDQNRHEEAEATLRKAIELDPANATTFNNLGTLLVDLNRYDKAEATFRRAIELDPKLQAAYDNLVILLRPNNRIEEILPLLEKIIELKPRDFNSYIALASIKKQTGKGISKNDIDKARQYTPEDNWYNQSCIESICENFDLAFEYLQRATQNKEFNSSWAWEDPDLQWIRNDPRFAKIVGAKPEEI
jgi:tetratricopeptide (TPR) repeat protein